MKRHDGSPAKRFADQLDLSDTAFRNMTNPPLTTVSEIRVTLRPVDGTKTACLALGQTTKTAFATKIQRAPVTYGASRQFFCGHIFQLST